jgi:hypothetical protein
MGTVVRLCDAVVRCLRELACVLLWRAICRSVEGRWT